MKLSVLFLICSLSMTYAAESYAQKTMISLEVRNETVGTVLEKLKKESGFDFFFNNILKCFLCQLLSHFFINFFIFDFFFSFFGPRPDFRRDECEVFSA